MCYPIIWNLVIDQHQASTKKRRKKWLHHPGDMVTGGHSGPNLKTYPWTDKQQRKRKKGDPQRKPKKPQEKEPPPQAARAAFNKRKNNGKRAALSWMLNIKLW